MRGWSQLWTPYGAKPGTGSMPQMVCPFMEVIGPGGTTGRIAVLADGLTTVTVAGRLA
ncbi:hypothetical protein AB0F68_07875 [Micromonospora sp. NPDC023966]|uniref:hypothetical protein n=1 Tax=Micromonospora sp. NPDC023966 TaxID=3154699 RepID=UPI0034109739